MGLATKMEAFESAMTSKISRELAKHEEIMTLHHEQATKERIDVKKFFTEMKHTFNSNILHL
jgi:hypothetical protein